MPQTIRNLSMTVGLLLILAGCANQEAFRQGKSLIETGKPEEGLPKIQQAITEQPNNLEYRAYYYRQRENWSARLLKDGDTARANRRWDEAAAYYLRVQAIDSDSARARDGLIEVEAGKRREALMQEANQQFLAQHHEAALEKVRRVLAEEPANEPARALAFRIERQLAAQSTPSARLAEKFRKPVSLELKNASAKTVFEMLSKAAGINFLLDRDLPPDLKINIFVRQTTIEAALQNILSTSQLGRKVLDENSVLIYPQNKKADYEEILVRTFYLNSADPKQAMELVKTVLKTKDIFVDDKLNIMVIRDTAENIRLAEKLMASYDLSDPEVLLEVEVLEISSAKLQELGVKYPSQLSVGVKGTPGAGQLTFNDIKHFGSDMGIVTITDPTFVLNLQASDGASKLLANPKIRVKNHKKAKIHIGDRVPVITTTSTSTGFSSETVNYLDVGLKLDVEPSVQVADEVSIDVGMEVSNIVNEIISKNGTLTYRIGTRNANTTLRLKNGETQMLAGLINDTERSSTDRVPGISSLPIIGRLFASKRDTYDKTEIVLLITPHIVRNIVPPDASYVEFSLGTESGNASATRATASAIAPRPFDTPPQQQVMETPDAPPTGAPEGVPQDSAAQIPALPPPPPLPAGAETNPAP